ncbi:hypothetical protein BVC80_8661g7 [Macleaya cordata]|uniref:Retrotransposon gag domain-containing protein n=1 Tax=Macleaya cordata TaxID=56857 RepID=A0A200Q539_MACCD|nr:hypothetical protein BVC80_8661g7 [Macleaya cordata]
MSSSVTDYLARFEDLFIRCDVHEEAFVTVTRIINGLRPNIKREVKLYSPDTLEEAFHKALEIEKYLRFPAQRHVVFQIGEQQQSKITFERSRGVTQMARVPSGGPNTTPFRAGPPKGTDIPASSSRSIRVTLLLVVLVVLRPWRPRSRILLIRNMLNRL